MGNSVTQSSSVALIAAMVTPALLILASASLVASALQRMGRVVDRSRILAAAIGDGSWERLGVSRAELGAWLDRHARRARVAEASILVFYAAIVIFIITCLAIPFDLATDHAVGWLPPLLAIVGTLLLLFGGALMVVESRLSATQIAEEIDHAVRQLKEGN
jgi:uncharacterized protein DUF2721